MVLSPGLQIVTKAMANRAKSLDDTVFSIEDLKWEGSLRLPKMYRGL